MRILLCTKNDLPALVAANLLADGLRGHEVTIWLSNKTRPAERESPDLDLLRFFERELPLRWLLPRTPQTHPTAGRFLPFHALARSLGGTVTIVPRLRAAERSFRALAPDLVLSIRFSHIFPPDLIAVSRHGILNIHPGYLPEYGGLFTPFHQIAAGHTRIGCTLHFIDEGIDTGPIVDVSSIPVDPTRSLLWHVAATYPAALPALRRAIDALARGEQVTSKQQNPAERRYYKIPSAAELAAFQNHFQLVSPSDFAEIMARFGVGPDVETGVEHAAAVAATC